MHCAASVDVVAFYAFACVLETGAVFFFSSSFSSSSFSRKRNLKFGSVLPPV